MTKSPTRTTPSEWITEDRVRTNTGFRPDRTPAPAMIEHGSAERQASSQNHDEVAHSHYSIRVDHRRSGANQYGIQARSDPCARNDRTRKRRTPGEFAKS